MKQLNSGRGVEGARKGSGREPCLVPHYAQWDAVADLDLYPSTMSGIEKKYILYTARQSLTIFEQKLLNLNQCPFRTFP